MVADHSEKHSDLMVIRIPKIKLKTGRDGSAKVAGESGQEIDLGR